VRRSAHDTKTSVSVEEQRAKFCVRSTFCDANRVIERGDIATAIHGSDEAEVDEHADGT
jgi:hypothetical protein